MANAPRILICDALDDLDKPELDRFTARLLERREDNLKPERLKKSQVKNKNTLELADRLVGCFGSKSVAITVALLRAIDENNVANELETKDPEALQPSCEKSGGASGSTARDMSDATAEMEHFVDRHRNALIERVSNTGPLLDRLLHQKILQQEQYDEALDLRPKQAQMRFIFRDPLRSGGERSKDALLSALRELEPCLIKDLQEKEG